jgi:rhodanese-related sulfurtransferase
MELGYTEVRVMKAGIKGWVGAGFEVKRPGR